MRKSLGSYEKTLWKTQRRLGNNVQKRVDEGADYIKIIADVPGPDQSTLIALADTAQDHRKRTVAHAASLGPFKIAQEARVDMIIHVPLDQDLDAESVE